MRLSSQRTRALTHGGPRPAAVLIGQLVASCYVHPGPAQPSDVNPAATSTSTGVATISGLSSGSASSLTESGGTGLTSTDTGTTVESGTTAETGGVRIDCSAAELETIPPSCRQAAPSGAFDPRLQWSFGQGDTLTAGGSFVTPLVANLTDDNDDDVIDMCDIPDVVLVAYVARSADYRLHVLDGATGTLHYEHDVALGRASTPAIGDIDNDGFPEIVAATPTGVVAIEHDGTTKWTSATLFSSAVASHAVALADVDNDGDVEIGLGNVLLDHEGAEIVRIGGEAASDALVFADMDGDDDMEIIVGAGVWHHTGAQAFATPSPQVGAFTQVADINDDGQPELIIVNSSGVSIQSHIGEQILTNQRPTGEGAGVAWGRPISVHDFDGDGAPELAFGTGASYGVWEADLMEVWHTAVSDVAGFPSASAFDLLGDGHALALYANENWLWAFDGSGSPVIQQMRSSPTYVEYPVVVDVDNDGSAEILVVSAANQPTLQVFHDRDDRWVPARRIWNQHTYHVTNVREDGTIPSIEPKHWLGTNSFRANAQIEDGVICIPVAVR